MDVEENDVNIQHGPKMSFEIPNETLGQFIFSQLKSHNPYDVLMCEAETSQTITSPEFLNLSIRVADALMKNGMRPGDVVCIMGKAAIRAYAAATGTLFGGGVASPLDHNLPSDVFKLILSTSEPKFVFCDAEIGEQIAEVLLKLDNPARIILLNESPDRETSHQTFEEFITSEMDLHNFRPVCPKDPENLTAFLVCSSGTMGIPKPVVITNRNLLYQVKIWSYLGSINKILTCPLITFSFFFWISGILVFLTAVCKGVEMTIVQKLEPKHVLQVIERHKPVWGMFSPALLKLLTYHPDFKNYNLSSLALMVTGGCSLQKVLAEKVKELWGPHLKCSQSYGVTEVSGSATSSGMQDDVLSVGRLLPGFQMKIVSTTDDRILGCGEEGEIYLKSPSVMAGYLKNEEATKGVLKNGWYRTGDFGFFSEKGLLYLRGRVKDFIRFKNHLISPSELEELLLTLPDVIDAGVVGIKIDEENSAPMALIVKIQGADLSQDDIIKYINGKIADYKQLRGVFFVDALPKTPSGKMKRTELTILADSLYSKGR